MKINYTTASTSTFKPLYVANISYSSNEKELSVNLMNKLIQKNFVIVDLNDCLVGYIENYKNGKQVENFVFHEKQDRSSKMNEYMILGLRQIDGVEIQKFKAKFGENPIYVYHKELEKLVNEDLLEIDGDIIKITNKGLDLANLVWEEFV